LTDSELIAFSATDAAAEIARGAVSAEDYTRACLGRIAVAEPEIGAFAHLDPEHALAQARTLDELRASGRPIGPLHGVPVAIKDIFDTSDFPTECGSPLLAGRRPRSDATVVSKLRAAGALIIGKTVTTEFAYFHPGKTRNPHDVARTPGGSSSGSAAAVAAGMVPLAIGTQTNGSIIRPGSFCGVFALKPTHGLVSRNGVLALSRTLDHVGPFARSLEDVATILEVIAGYDPEDEDTRPIATAGIRKIATEDFPLAPRFAFVRTPVWDKADAATRAAFEQLAQSLGEQCFEFDLPERFAAAWGSHRDIMAVEMAHNLGSIVDSGGEQVSQVLRDLVAQGRKVSAARYLLALDEARALRPTFDDLFMQQCSAIITLATTGIAPTPETTGSPVFCSLWTLMGLPSLALPLLEGEDGMPLGVQLVGARGDDARLLRNAKWLEDAVRGRSKSRKSGKGKSGKT
jgi:Asp-tRNA(Asn)/Glu-tRNA(Gln) amidotransferase A subunit family amidase